MKVVMIITDKSREVNKDINKINKYDFVYYDIYIYF